MHETVTPNHRLEPEMSLRARQRISQLEREERQSLANFDDYRYRRSESALRGHRPRLQSRQWPWVLLIVGIVGVLIYAIATTPDWFGVEIGNWSAR